MSLVATSLVNPFVLGNNRIQSSNFQQTLQANAVQEFGQILQVACENMRRDITVADVIYGLEELGLNVTVRSVPNNHDALVNNANAVGRGWNSVTISPNIVQQMAEDENVRQKYTDKILWWQNTYLPSVLSTTPIHGGRFTGMTKTIHEDGTVTYVLFGQAPHEINGENAEDENAGNNVDYTHLSHAEYRTEEFVLNELNPLINENHLVASYAANLMLSETMRQYTRQQSNLTDGTEVKLPLDVPLEIMENNLGNHLADSKTANLMLSSSILELYRKSSR